MLTEQIDGNILQLICDIRSGTLEGSYNITVKALHIFKKIIEDKKWKHAAELMGIIRVQCYAMKTALPRETVASNMGRRILRVIREEYELLRTKEIMGADENADNPQTAMSLHKLVTQTSESSTNIDYTKDYQKLLEAVLDNLQEIENELECSTENLCKQAETHIHSSEIILTLGHSRSVEHFLRRAIKKRQFLTIIIAECSPENRGHNLAVNLASERAEIIVIPDAAIFAMMSRVNKVIIGTHSVLANGGLRAACGTYTAALAAKHFSVPVFVLAPMYKLSSLHRCEQNSTGIIGCAESVALYDSAAARQSLIVNPIFDYVPPELVTLFISNISGHAPSYVYRLLSELYHPEDLDV